MATTDDEKNKTVASPRAIASEGSRRCRAAAARRTSVFETRRVGRRNRRRRVRTSSRDRSVRRRVRQSSLSGETPAARTLGAVSIWSAPSGRPRSGSRRAGRSTGARQNQTLPSIDQVSIESSSTSSSIASQAGPRFRRRRAETRRHHRARRRDAVAVRGPGWTVTVTVTRTTISLRKATTSVVVTARCVGGDAQSGVRVAEEDTLRKRGPAGAGRAGRRVGRRRRRRRSPARVRRARRPLRRTSRRAHVRRDLRGFSPAEELAGHHGRRGRRRPRLTSGRRRRKPGGASTRSGGTSTRRAPVREPP